MSDQVIQIGNAPPLVSILSTPRDAKNLPAVLVLNAGLIHRVGPSRLYVQIAHRLANLGFTVLRFDYSGVGDSGPRLDHLPFIKSSIVEAQAAMDWLARARGIERFVLLGHCAGASNAFRVAGADTRVIGAVMINIEPTGDQWTTYDRERKMTRYYSSYYARSVTDRTKWIKVLTGKADYANLARTAWRTLIWNRIAFLRARWAKPDAETQQSSAIASEIRSAEERLRLLAERGVRLLFTFPQGSTGYEYVQSIMGRTFVELVGAQRIDLVLFPQTDHLFTRRQSQMQLLQTVENWMAKLGDTRS